MFKDQMTNVDCTYKGSVKFETAAERNDILET
jgi:hypothetical protein